MHLLVPSKGGPRTWMLRAREDFATGTARKRTRSLSDDFHVDRDLRVPRALRRSGAVSGLRTKRSARPLPGSGDQGSADAKEGKALRPLVGGRCRGGQRDLGCAKRITGHASTPRRIL